jgi:Fe2+ transport system protein B
MLKWIGAVSGLLAIVWMVLQKETLSWASISSGVVLASAVFIVLSKTEKRELPPAQDKLQWQAKLDEAEAKASQTIDGLNRELQKLQLKSIRSEERCLSYQKLVEVHQQEIEKLRSDNQTVAQQLIQKERKLSELYLAKMEPDLFDSQRLQVETINRELKKQLLDTKSELAEISSKKKRKPATEASAPRDLLA